MQEVKKYMKKYMSIYSKYRLQCESSYSFIDTGTSLASNRLGDLRYIFDANRRLLNNEESKYRVLSLFAITHFIENNLRRLSLK